MKRLLYVSPVTPALTGNGLAMRAGMVMEALAAHHRVSLLVVQIYGEQNHVVPAELAALCERSAVVTPPPARQPWWPPRRDPGPWKDWRRMGFNTVHAFRLATIPFARRFLGVGAGLHLDLDDIESVARARIAALARANGDSWTAKTEEAQARLATTAEHEAFALARRVYVCSEQDAALLAPRVACELRVLANAVRLPRPFDPPNREPFRLLFLGSLGYYPNEDAALFLCHEVAPRLRLAGLPIELEIAGGGASARLARAAADAGVALTGPAPDVDPLYQRASAAVVPIRAGGGTRIKILEAFAYRRPVVATTIGAEGIDVLNGRELLIADTADAFVATVARLAGDPDFAAGLTARAFALVSSRHSLEAMKLASA